MFRSHPYNFAHIPGVSASSPPFRGLTGFFGTLIRWPFLQSYKVFCCVVFFLFAYFYLILLPFSFIILLLVSYGLVGAEGTCGALGALSCFILFLLWLLFLSVRSLMYSVKNNKLFRLIPPVYVSIFVYCVADTLANR